MAKDEKACAEVNSKRTYAKVMHMYAGVELIGSKTSVHQKEAEMELRPDLGGVRLVSKKTKRVILIPFANIKGVELLPDHDSAHAKA
jgi:hypothetical protein